MSFTAVNRATVPSMGYRMNYGGGATVHGEGVISTFGGAERAHQTHQFVRRHHPYDEGGHLGITHMRPCKADGGNLSEKELEQFEVVHNGRGYGVNSNGVLRYCDTAAFMPTIKANLEHESYLAKMSTFLLAGDQVCEQIFGGDFLTKCGTTDDAKMTVNGTEIPAALAKENCTPSLLRLYDPSMKEFLRGSAKLRALINAFPVIPLGDLPNWDMSVDGAGEKDYVDQHPAAVDAVQQEMGIKPAPKAS